MFHSVLSVEFTFSPAGLGRNQCGHHLGLNNRRVRLTAAFQDIGNRFTNVRTVQVKTNAVQQLSGIWLGFAGRSTTSTLFGAVPAFVNTRL